MRDEPSDKSSGAARTNNDLLRERILEEVVGFRSDLEGFSAKVRSPKPNDSDFESSVGQVETSVAELETNIGMLEPSLERIEMKLDGLRADLIAWREEIREVFAREGVTSRSRPHS